MVCHEAACALVPSMSTLDNPAFCLHDETLGDDFGPQGLLRVLPSACAAVAGVAHDLDTDAVRVLDGLGAFAAIGAVGVELLQAGDFGASLHHDLCGRVTILDACCGDRDGQQQAQGIDHQMALAPLDFLARIKTSLLPPCAVLRVLCASMTAAVGSGALPMRSRHCWRRRSCMASNTPAAAHRLKAM